MKMSYSPFPNSGMLQHGPKVNCVWYIRLKKIFSTDELKENIVIKVAISQKELGPNYSVVLSFETVKAQNTVGLCLTPQNTLSTC